MNDKKIIYVDCKIEDFKEIEKIPGFLHVRNYLSSNDKKDTELGKIEYPDLIIVYLFFSQARVNRAIYTIHTLVEFLKRMIMHYQLDAYSVTCSFEIFKDYIKFGDYMINQLSDNKHDA